MQHPKIVILGAGSFFFGRKAIWQMVHSPHLREGTLALVDTDGERLEKMRRLAELARDHHGVKLAIEASTDRREVLEGSDFIVLSFADRNAHFRGVDCEVAARYGIRMCSGDTIGPGGVMRSARELPEVLRCCEDISNLCPDAWVINYVNPTTVHGMAIRRYFPKLKSLALCDAQWGLRNRFAQLADVPNDEKLTVLSAGPNHYTWLLKAEYDGRDLMPDIIASLRASAEADFNEQAQGGGKHAKGWLNNSIAIELYDAFGVLPTVLGHTKEYVPFYQGRGVSGNDRHPPLKLFEADERTRQTEKAWAQVDAFLSGEQSMDSFDEQFGPDPATDLIEGMWAKPASRFFVNTTSHGAVPNLSHDAFIELYCELDMDGPRPLPCPPMPRGVRGLCEQVLDTHELTAEGIYEGDLKLLRRALLTDPLTMSIGDTDAMLEAFLECERDAIDAERYGLSPAAAG